uniref:Uncharacterized protein LOC111117085 isoform X2 n=1 Tax=Crassostrea virginica TaxID=6565 RepID=A0A8B8C808_CRAVI|nr:uncharacterized protein LOC111117085 isoform X2 [Crassostrea virginica]
MERVMFTCFVVCGLLSTAQGGSLYIFPKFMDGNVTFSWNGDPAQLYYVLITKDRANDPWLPVTGTQYTVEDALLYDSISIKVYSSVSREDISNLTFKVSKVESNIKDSVNISWTAPFFPQAGEYIVYHTGNVNRSIIEVTSSGATFFQTKYEYHSRPYNSKNITFEIRDITRDDAGYYNGGVSPAVAWSGGGVVLIVHDKPSKPKIQGNLNIMVDSYSNLTCSSFSTTAPDYYARLRPLSYTWYVNNTKLFGETRETLRLRVTRNHKYNQYSFRARDKLESDRSDHVIINPLYTPDILMILPKPQLNLNDNLIVKEGDYLGPYTCTADCNPPCDISWKYKDSTSGDFFDVASTGLLIGHIVNRSIAVFSCFAKYSPDKDFKQIESIKLDVLYLDEPQLVYNENSPLYTYQEVLVQEKTPLHLFCHVNGNPNPTIRLHRGVNANIIAETNSSTWLNHTIASLQCSDTDEYTCTGETKGLTSRKKVVRINVLCDVRVNNKDKVEVIRGFNVGLQRTVIIKLPIIAYPQPVPSRITWVDPEGQMINGTNDLLLPTYQLYSHLITSVVLLPEVDYYGEYSVQYNGTPLTKIQITKRESFLTASERKGTLKIDLSFINSRSLKTMERRTGQIVEKYAEKTMKKESIMAFEKEMIDVSRQAEAVDSENDHVARENPNSNLKIRN